MRRNGDSDERVESVVNPSLMELQPDLSSDRGLGEEKKREVECIGRGVPAEEQGRYRQPRWGSSSRALSRARSIKSRAGAVSVMDERHQRQAPQ